MYVHCVCVYVRVVLACETMISRLTSMLGASARVGDAASTRAVCRTDCQELTNHVHRAQIWRRGLLLKGNGLCHGVAGSGYALLSLYKHTRDPVHLERCVAVTVVWSLRVVIRCDDISVANVHGKLG